VAENISTITGYPHYQHTADAIAAAIRKDVNEAE
jgi:hypothetical protein